MSKDKQQELKTYMPFTLPIDPANIRTLVDLDLSYALAETLVKWNSSQELVSGLAKSWETTAEKEITFQLSDEAKWSDGSLVTADQVVRSFKRAKLAHQDSLKPLFDIIESITAVEPRSVAFKLNVPASTSGLVRKLTEPMYGTLFVKEDGSINLEKTTGPFKLDAASESEISLASSKHSKRFHSAMADSVKIRPPHRSAATTEPDLSDDWMNVLSTSSLGSQSTLEKYKQAGYEVWPRALDKTFFLGLSPKLANQEGHGLLRYLNSSLDRSRVVAELAGYHLTDQFFPGGYVLFDPEFQKSAEEKSLPQVFSERPLTILAIEDRVPERLRKNLEAAVLKATGHKPEIKLVALEKFEKTRAAGDYHLIAASLPVNDPNVEGFMGFAFELTPPIIPGAGHGEKDFPKRVKAARALESQDERNSEYRKIFTTAIKEGSVLPLFHYSSVVLAKKGIDLSQVPTTDETVSFSKVRFK